MRETIFALLSHAHIPDLAIPPARFDDPTIDDRRHRDADDPASLAVAGISVAIVLVLLSLLTAVTPTPSRTEAGKAGATVEGEIPT